MRGARGWIVAAAVAIVIAAAAYLLQPHSDSPEHSSNSDAANGASAALLFAQSMGHPTEQITGNFDPPPASESVMFVFSPTSPYTADEAQRLLEWVRIGGSLIYASEQGDPELDRAFGVTRLGGYASGGVYTAAPFVEGVNTVAVTAGASAPEVLVKDVVEYLQMMGYGSVDEVEVMPENVRFGLPPEIVQAIASAPPVGR